MFDKDPYTTYGLMKKETKGAKASFLPLNKYVDIFNRRRLLVAKELMFKRHSDKGSKGWKQFTSHKITLEYFEDPKNQYDMHPLYDKISNAYSTTLESYYADKHLSYLTNFECVKRIIDSIIVSLQNGELPDPSQGSTAILEFLRSKEAPCHVGSVYKDWVSRVLYRAHQDIRTKCAPNEDFVKKFTDFIETAFKKDVEAQKPGFAFYFLNLTTVQSYEDAIAYKRQRVISDLAKSIFLWPIYTAKNCVTCAFKVSFCVLKLIGRGLYIPFVAIPFLLHCAKKP